MAYRDVGPVVRFTREEERELILRWQKQKDQKARALLVDSLTGFMLQEVKKFVFTKGGALQSKHPLEDLRQEGFLGLLEAIDRFDVSRGTRLSTYSMLWIRAFLYTYIRHNHRIMRTLTTESIVYVYYHLGDARRDLGPDATDEALAKHLKVSLKVFKYALQAIESSDMSMTSLEKAAEHDAYYSLAISTNPERYILRALDLQRNRKRLERGMANMLQPRERRILRARYMRDEPATFTELAELNGVSRQALQQAEKKALKRLKAARSLREGL